MKYEELVEKTIEYLKCNPLAPDETVHDFYERVMEYADTLNVSPPANQMEIREIYFLLGGITQLLELERDGN